VPTPMSPFVFEGFPDNDWKSATPPLLMEAVLSVRKLTEDGFFRIDRRLEEEENIKRESRPWVFFGVCYKNRKKEAQRAAREVFDKFLQIATTNRALINASPVAWAHGQTEALLREEFGSAKSAQEFFKIKFWIKDYCDGKDQSVMPDIQSGEEWKEYLCRESWRAPVWLRVAASRQFTTDTSAWDDLGEQRALQRLDKEETEKLLDVICRWFWSGVQAALEHKARLESVNCASRAACESARPSPNVSETALRFIHRGKNLVAKQCDDMEAAIAHTYTLLISHMEQAQSIVRASRGKITATELKSNFKNTYFVKALDMADWELLIEEFRKKRPAGCRNLTLGVLARRTGKSIATVDKYTKPSRTRKKTTRE
jgi:hypothetical protein